MIWHSTKRLFNNGGFVCVTETPTGSDLFGVLAAQREKKDLSTDNFFFFYTVQELCPQLSRVCFFSFFFFSM